MFRFLSLLGGSTSRCRLTTLLLMAFVAMSFGSVAQAQEHGASISKGCTGPVRSCDIDADCADADLCTPEVCNLLIPDATSCTFTAAHNDQLGDNLAIVAAWDVINPDGLNGQAPIRSPLAGDAPIIDITGNAVCTNTVGGALDVTPITFNGSNALLPCSIGPDLGGGIGAVQFGSEGYEPTADDPSPLPDQVTVTVVDLCDGTPDGNCLPDFENDVEFSAQTNVVDGCESGGPPVTCPDGDQCITEACNPNSGQCEVIDEVICPDNPNQCLTDECNPANGLCEVVDETICPDNPNQCLTDDCNPANGLCEVVDETICPDNPNQCLTDDCNPANGQCEVVDEVVCDDETCTECDPLDGACKDKDPYPEECVDEGRCRTPGYWGSHGGTEKLPKSTNVTQGVIDSVGALQVCGFTITQSDLLYDDSALEAMCVSVKGESVRQLLRQMTAATLNVVISGGNGDGSGTAQAELMADCNDVCAGTGDPTRDMQQCIGEVDCYNNGGSWDSVLDMCIWLGTCYDDGDLMTGSGDRCYFDEDGIPDGCNEEFEDCFVDETCHDRDLCPGLDDDILEPGELCFAGGPASSPSACKDARKNNWYMTD